MKITIETNESDRVEMKPEVQGMVRQGQGVGAGTGAELVATDAGPPAAELLQSLADRSVAASSGSPSQFEQAEHMGMLDGGPAQSRH